MSKCILAIFTLFFPSPAPYTINPMHINIIWIFSLMMRAYLFQCDGINSFVVFAFLNRLLDSLRSPAFLRGRLLVVINRTLPNSYRSSVIRIVVRVWEEGYKKTRWDKCTEFIGGQNKQRQRQQQQQQHQNEKINHISSWEKEIHVN